MDDITPKKKSLVSEIKETLEDDKKTVEKDTRGAVHRGLREGLLQLGRLPEFLAHEFEKFANYIHDEVSKL